MGLTSHRTGPVRATVGAIAMATLIAVSASGCAAPSFVAHTDPDVPTYTIEPLAQLPSGERTQFGPASVIVPDGWTHSTEPAPVYDLDGVEIGRTYAVTLVPDFDEELGCTLAYESTPGLADDGYLSRSLEDLEYWITVQGKVGTHVIGYAEWGGEQGMIYSTFTDPYRPNEPRHSLYVHTYDSSGQWDVYMSMGGYNVDPKDLPCYQILQTLEVD